MKVTFMKCKYCILDSEYVTSCVFIDDHGVYLEKLGETQKLNVSFESYFNTLISLFSLKSNWYRQECANPTYIVVFENKGNEEVFKFDLNTMPDNWDMFLGYINKLVGEAL